MGTTLEEKITFLPVECKALVVKFLFSWYLINWGARTCVVQEAHYILHHDLSQCHSLIVILMLPPSRGIREFGWERRRQVSFKRDEMSSFQEDTNREGERASCHSLLRIHGIEVYTLLCVLFILWTSVCLHISSVSTREETHGFRRRITSLMSWRREIQYWETRFQGSIELFQRISFSASCFLSVEGFSRD